MTLEEKLQTIERVLNVEPNTLTLDTLLADTVEWDSLNILNLLIEFTVWRTDLQFDNLHACKTVGDLCTLV
ncbi:MAG TPA: acyl carrier protein [Clostridiales bacterium]|nr:acyl carrier protein [Clostridiales bacterium]